MGAARMDRIADEREFWPVLDYPPWRDTAQTLQLWTQIVGKVRLALSPWLNHGWQVPLYVNARGLGTSAIHDAKGRVIEIDFDFVDHRLVIRSSDGPERGFALAPMSVAAFHRRTMGELDAAGVRVRINPMPNEVPAPIVFPDDEQHASYDAGAVHRFWRALAQSDRVFRVFRSGFVGKASPVHFFWGGFDLATTRFSGRTAPRHPGGVPNCADWVMHDAYSHEVSSGGLWPGGSEEGSFYSYAYPEPAGFAESAVQPETAYYDTELREFILPYRAVRTASDPDGALLAFLQSTYEAAATTGDWDRRALEAKETRP